MSASGPASWDRWARSHCRRADVGIRLGEVVVARPHRETPLRDVEGVDVAVHQIGLDADARRRGWRPKGAGRAMAPVSCERSVMASSSPSLGLDRGGPLGVEPHGVKPDLVEVRDLLLDAACAGLHPRHLREEVVDALLVVFAQYVEGTVARIFGFERVFGLPPARGVLVEIGMLGATVRSRFDMSMAGGRPLFWQLAIQAIAARKMIFIVCWFLLCGMRAVAAAGGGRWCTLPRAADEEASPCGCPGRPCCRVPKYLRSG